MTAVLLGVMVALTASAVSWVTGSLVVAAVWPSLRRPVDQLPSGVRAQVLAMLRLFPAATAVLALPLVFISFVSLEPAETREEFGVLLVTAAIGGLAAMLIGIARAWRACRATTRALRQWVTPQRAMQRGIPILTIDEPFPIVAAVGIRRPRVYIARHVLAVCDQPEVEAMLAHEEAHVAAHDNLTRLLFLCALPVFGFSRLAAELEASWTKATEEAADDLACRDDRSALALASALTKVLRLAAGHHAPVLHASAILTGATIEHRVRRLLLPRTAAGAPRLFQVVLGGAVMVAMGILLSPGRYALYYASELCVQYLP